MNEPQKFARYQTSVLFAFSFLTATTYVFMRALAVSLFLARTGPDALPLAFAASAFIVIGISGLTRVAVKKFPTNRAAVGTWIILALVTLVIGYVLGPLHHSLIALCGMYVFAEVRGCLNTIYVVTLSNEAFAGHASKRPYAIVASGAPIAGILVGSIIGFEASVVLVLPAFVATAIVDGLTAFTAFLFHSVRAVKENPVWSDRDDHGFPEDDLDPSQEEQSQSNYRFLLAALVSIKIAVLTLVGYQWKVSIGNYFGSDETQMLAYFAIFYAVSDTLIVLLHWLVVGHLLDRLGIGVGLVGFPIAISLIAIFALFVGSPLGFLIVFTLGKGLNVLRRALHDPGLTVAYSVIDPSIRPETIVFVKGMIKPFAEGVSASLLLVIGGVILEYWITWIWFLLTIPWFFFAIKVNRLYQSRASASSQSLESGQAAQMSVSD